MQGGGPGRYTIELAKRGFEVVLLDLSPRCLEIARREVRKAGVGDKVKEIVEGSITDLSSFSNRLFDGVLCLGGPLSHLLEKSEREQATIELLRVAKSNAPLFISVFNRYGVFRVVLYAHPENLTDSFHEEMFTKGKYRVHTRFGAFTNSYFFLPNELKEMFENNGVQTLTLATCEGLSAHLEGATNMLYRDKKKWRRWLKILFQTCTDPSIVGIGNHLLYVGRKRSRSEDNEEAGRRSLTSLCLSSFVKRYWMMSMQIADADENDVESLIRIYSSPHLYHNRREATWFVKSFFDYHHLKVTKHEGMIIGAIFWNVVEEKHHGLAEIRDFWIDENFRRRGLGERLLRTTVADMKRFFAESDYTLRKVLVTTGENNEPARKLYEKVGFQTSAALKDLYAQGETELVYILTLSP